jgi:hypothetical protein
MVSSDFVGRKEDSGGGRGWGMRDARMEVRFRIASELAGLELPEVLANPVGPDMLGRPSNIH